MKNTSEKIARNLDLQFAEMGFAVPGVDALREGADVSLRTLYKYYPSREAMVVGALTYRNTIYLEWIAGGPEMGVDHVLFPIIRLGDWLEKVTNNGCLFQNALAAYPESASIRKCVETHKEQVLNEFVARLERVAPPSDAVVLSEALFVIHEGQTAMAMIRDVVSASSAALSAARALLNGHGIT